MVMKNLGYTPTKVKKKYEKLMKKK